MSDIENWPEANGDDTENWYIHEVATFGDRLTAAREQAGLSQAELARKLGVKKSSLAAWEQDLDEPRANRLQMLSGLLGVSLMWVLTGEGDDVDAEASAPAADQELMRELRDIHAQLASATARLAVLEKRLRKGGAA